MGVRVASCDPDVVLQGTYLDSCSSTQGTLVDKKLERRGIVFGTVDSFKNFIVRHTDNWFLPVRNVTGGRVETAPE